MDQQIFIRAEGNFTIGLGHLTRCLALAMMVREDFKITFFCSSVPEGFVNQLNKCGFCLEGIDGESSFLEKIKPGSIVVLDGYNFTSDYQKKIKSLGAKLVLIDDLHNKEIFADLIINQTPGIKPSDYIKQWYTQLCLGLEYVLLRPDFLISATRNREIKKIENVLICFGGSDNKDLTILTLDMVKEFPVFKKIFVITGSAYKEKSSFQDLINSDDRIIRYNNLNEEQMLSVMMSAHLAIVPASSILLEVLAAKCLAISGFYVDNQKFLYENLRQLNAFTDAYDFNPEILRQSIFKALSETKNVPALIDGQSPFRIKKCFTTLRYDNLCFLRKVTPADLNLTYSWASDPIIRKYSFQAHEISMEVHTEWFNRKILDLNCYFFILVLGEEPVGSIRFDISSGIAIISYLVDSKFHGKGFGQVLLKKGIEQMLQIRNENKAKFNVFSGSVMFENIGSRKAFERLGFSSAPHEGYLKFELSI